VAHGVARCVQAFELDRVADLDDVTRNDATIHVRNTRARILVCNDSCTRCFNNALVTACVVAVFVRVEDLRDCPAAVFRNGQAFVVVKRIDCECVTSFRTDNQVVEVAIRVTGPDLFDNHCAASCRA